MGDTNKNEMTEQEQLIYLQDILTEMETLMNKFFTETDKWLKREKERLGMAPETVNNTIE